MPNCREPFSGEHNAKCPTHRSKLFPIFMFPMKETNFIKQNKEKWIEFEKQLQINNNDPEKLSNLFVQITDDLSYSRTFYRNRSVRVYLNNISQKVFQNIYRNRSRKRNRLTHFWKNELPQLAWQSRWDLSLSAIIFFLAVAIGVFSSVINPDFPRFIMGDEYVNMTIENIKKGDPMAVYGRMQEGQMFLQITFNNVLVAVITFAMGVFLGIGTVGSLIYNGIMIGTFHYFLYDKGVLGQAMTAVWLHGTLEISAIVIAGGAGLTMGRGLIFPGTLSRMQSFRLSSRRGLKIMLGTVPIFFFAAFIESFVTRYYNSVPDLAKLTLIFISLAFIIGYFVVLPYIRSRSGFAEDTEDGKLPPTPSDKVDLGLIRTNGEVFKDIFTIYGKCFRYIFPAAVFLALVYGVGVALFMHDAFFYRFNLFIFMPTDLIYKIFVFYGDMFQYFGYSELPALAIANILIFSIVAFICCAWVMKEAFPSLKISSASYIGLNFYKPLIAGIVISGILFLPDAWGPVLLGLFMPIFALWLVIMFRERTDPFSAFGKAFSYGFSSFGRTYGLYLISILVAFLFMAVVSSPFITWRIFEIINWNLSLNETEYAQLFTGFFTFLAMGGLCLVLPVMIIGYGILYHTQKEINEANTLKSRVALIGKKKKTAAITFD
jgi:uncharacterized membrane protein SpoIIM required for sporulation